MTKRVPPGDMGLANGMYWEAWYRTCLTDLAAGKHAKGCECFRWLECIVYGLHDCDLGKFACGTIARAALVGTEYEVEE